MMLRVLLLALSLALTGLARAGILVVASPALELGQLSSEDVRQIFSGRRNTVNGKAVEPVDLPADDPIRERFYRKVLDMNASQLRSHWVRMSFTGKGQPPEMLSGIRELKARLAADGARLIGYLGDEEADSDMDVVYRVD